MMRRVDWDAGTGFKAVGSRAALREVCRVEQDDDTCGTYRRKTRAGVWKQTNVMGVSK